MADTFGKLGKIVKKLGEGVQDLFRNPDLDKAKAGLKTEVEKRKASKEGNTKRKELKE